MAEIHEVLYPPKEEDARVANRLYDAKERLVVWSLRQDDHYLVFLVTSFREVTLGTGATLDIPESIECRFSPTEPDIFSYLALERMYSPECELREVCYYWTGREIDSEIDLQYKRARYCDPTPGQRLSLESDLPHPRRYFDEATGRWLGGDPLALDAGDEHQYPYPRVQPRYLPDEEPQDPL